jgi:Ca2+-binding EF-hand superfamily protein
VSGSSAASGSASGSSSSSESKQTETQQQQQQPSQQEQATTESSVSSSATEALKPALTQEEEDQIQLKRQLLREIESLNVLMNPSYMEEEKNLLSELKGKLLSKVKALEEQQHIDEDDEDDEVEEVKKSEQETLVDTYAPATPTPTKEEVSAPQEAPSAQEPSETLVDTYAAEEQKKGEEKEHEEEEEEEHERLLSKGEVHLKQMLERMVTNLEKGVEEADREIGEKLYLLDKDKDGVLSSDEMKEVVFKVLNNYSSEEEAERFVQSLDGDKDGFISVNELRQFVENHYDLLSENVFEKEGEKKQEGGEEKSSS